MEQLQLGDRAKDKVTGFTGIVTSMTTYLNGCIRVAIQPEELKDGKVPDSTFFDIDQIKIVQKEIHKPVILHAMPAPVPTPTAGTTGGPARETAGFKR